MSQVDRCIDANRLAVGHSDHSSWNWRAPERLGWAPGCARRRMREL